MKLSRAGYGDINTIKHLDSATFLSLIHYENYLVDYENALRAVNKKD